MALDAGDEAATTGMSKAIFDKLDEILSPPLKDLASEDLEKIRTGWKQLAFAISAGVVNHLTTQSEIKGVQIKIEDVTHTQTNLVRVE
jgi:hypothetical protein